MHNSADIDYGRKWHAMAAVGTGVFLATVDGSIINVSLPTLVRAFDSQFAVVQWVVLAYLLTITTTMLSIGRLADMVGKKQIYSLGFIVFTVGSLMCGTAFSVYWLIAFRIIQGIGSAMILALGAAILTEAFPPQERGKAMGLIGTVVSIGIVAGPALGGVIIGTLSWRWIFLVNLPVGIIGTIMVRRNVPDYKPAGRQRFDYLGALTLFFCLLSLLLGLTLGQQHGFFYPAVQILIGLSLVSLAVFIALEKRVAQPMIDLKMFDNMSFCVTLVTGFISFVGLAGVFILMPFYLENILGYNIIYVGLLMGIVPVMLGITSPFAGALSDRFGTRPLAVIGMGIMFIGYLAAGTLSQNTSAMGYCVRMFALGLGIGIFISPNNSSIMGTAQRHQLGIVSGMMAITRTLGQTIGVAVMGAVWAGSTAVYAGGQIQGGATAAPVDAQIAGLNDTFQTAAALLAFALLLGIWAHVTEVRHQAALKKSSVKP
jgi:EmrB/QacA subfamily drug resistance transporter